MKTKKGNVAAIALIVIIVAITAGVIGWMFAKKTQAPIVSNSQPIAANLQAPQQPTVPTDETADYFLVPEMGIKFKVPVSLKNDLVYTVEKNPTRPGEPKIQVVELTSKSLIREGGDGCLHDGLGNLIKVNADFTKDALYVNPPKDAHWATTKEGLTKAGAVQFDGFYVWFQSPQAVCADVASPAVENLLISQGHPLAEAVKNIELIK